LGELLLVGGVENLEQKSRREKQVVGSVSGVDLRISSREQKFLAGRGRGNRRRELGEILEEPRAAGENSEILGRIFVGGEI